MKKLVVALAFVLAQIFSVSVNAENNPTAKQVSTIAYSADTEVFYFWLDGYTITSSVSDCSDITKFGIVTTSTADAQLVAVIKMAFLSGKSVKVYWNKQDCTGTGTSGSTEPYYIKVYQ